MKVRDGQIADESSTLIHPPAGFDHLDGSNTWLHGITVTPKGSTSDLLLTIEVQRDP
jgi:hypothetical protein